MRKSRRELMIEVEELEEQVRREQKLQQVLTRRLYSERALNVQVKEKLYVEREKSNKIITYLLDRSDFGRAYLTDIGDYTEGNSYDIQQLYEDIEKLDTVLDQAAVINRLGV